jgi:hypothetical protein
MYKNAHLAIIVAAMTLKEECSKEHGEFKWCVSDLNPIEHL